MYHYLRDPRDAVGLTLGLGRMAKAEHGPWKYILRYGAVSGALLRQRLPRHAAVRADYGGALCAGAAVYQPARRPAGDQRPDERRLCPRAARQLRAFLSCIVAITLNAGAYVSEIFRAGIQSIDKGQMEASRALGMPWWKTMRKVILPQAFRRILPPLGNNAIAIVKDSSLASAIGPPIWPMPRAPSPAPTPPTGNPT